MTNLQLSENVNYMPPEKWEEVFDYIKNNMTFYKLTWKDVVMIFKIAYRGGLRVNEVLKLTKASFDFNTLQINLGKTKTKSHDMASFPNSFLVELQTYLITERKETDKHALLFPISRQQADQYIRKIGKALSITAWTTPQSESGEKTKTHLPRKSIGKDMLYKKAPLNIIMNKLRHTDLKTTSQYLKLNLADVQSWENDNL